MKIKKCKKVERTINRLKQDIKGITMVALVVTIIVLLILAGIAVRLIIGDNGLLKRAQNATEKYKEAQINEEQTIEDMYSSIKIADGGSVTLSLEQLNKYIDDKVEEKISNKKVQKNILWTGNASSGILELNDSIYNYSYLIFTLNYGTSAIIDVTPDLQSFAGGANIGGSNNNWVNYLGFYVSSVTDEGRKLTLTRTGKGDSNSNWIASVNVFQITGI